MRFHKYSDHCLGISVLPLYFRIEGALVPLRADNLTYLEKIYLMTTKGPSVSTIKILSTRC